MPVTIVTGPTSGGSGGDGLAGATDPTGDLGLLGAAPAGEPHLDAFGGVGHGRDLALEDQHSRGADLAVVVEHRDLLGWIAYVHRRGNRSLGVASLSSGFPRRFLCFRCTSSAASSRPTSTGRW